MKKLLKKLKWLLSDNTQSKMIYAMAIEIGIEPNQAIILSRNF